MSHREPKPELSEPTPGRRGWLRTLLAMGAGSLWARSRAASPAIDDPTSAPRRQMDDSAPPPQRHPAVDPTARQRQQMVDEIAAMARATAAQTGRAQFAEPVMRAMATVPRHRFVPAADTTSAYRNHPLPIGSGQTVSQPYIVALSTDLIDPQPGQVVLEIGTGSGYQAAVLAELVARVYSIEIVEALGNEAAARLAALGYRNVEVRIGDGYKGWPEAAPFDGIVVTAAAPFVPEPLVEQLKPGGRMVIPVGSQWMGQDLQVVEKRSDGTTTRRTVLPVRFVPMTGEGVRKGR